MVLRGSIKLHHAEGVAVAAAGQMLHLTPGERVRWEFPDPEGCEYLPVCLPGFSPDLVVVEPGRVPLSRTTVPPRPEYKTLYHLVQLELWETAKASGATYYPPTYEQEKFTHATANPEVSWGAATLGEPVAATLWTPLTPPPSPAFPHRPSFLVAVPDWRGEPFLQERGDHMALPRDDHRVAGGRGRPDHLREPIPRGHNGSPQ